MSFVIPTNELTLTDMKTFRAEAVEAGVQRGLALGLARTRGELVARSAYPFTDFGAGAVGWVLEQYAGPVIAAAGWGSPFSAGALPANVPQLARTKIAVFYKFADYTAAPLITGVRFRVGATGATTKASFYQQLETGSKLEPDVYFSEAVVYDPEDFVYIEAYYQAAAVAGAEAFAFGCFIIERVGGTIS